MATKMKLVPAEWLDDKPSDETFIGALPKTVAEDAKRILVLVRNNAGLTDSGQVIYDSGHIGSNVVDHMRYVLLPKQPRPYDSKQFEQVLGNAEMKNKGSKSDQPINMDKLKRSWHEF